MMKFYIYLHIYHFPCLSIYLCFHLLLLASGWISFLAFVIIQKFFNLLYIWRCLHCILNFNRYFPWIYTSTLTLVLSFLKLYRCHFIVFWVSLFLIISWLSLCFAVLLYIICLFSWCFYDCFSISSSVTLMFLGVFLFIFILHGIHVDS